MATSLNSFEFLPSYEPNRHSDLSCKAVGAKLFVKG